MKEGCTNYSQLYVVNITEQIVMGTGWSFSLFPLEMI